MEICRQAGKSGFQKVDGGPNSYTAICPACKEKSRRRRSAACSVKLVGIAVGVPAFGIRTIYQREDKWDGRGNKILFHLEQQANCRHLSRCRQDCAG